MTIRRRLTRSDSTPACRPNTSGGAQRSSAASDTRNGSLVNEATSRGRPRRRYRHRGWSPRTTRAASGSRTQAAGHDQLHDGGHVEGAHKDWTLRGSGGRRAPRWAGFADRNAERGSAVDDSEIRVSTEGAHRVGLEHQDHRRVPCQRGQGGRELRRRAAAAPDTTGAAAGRPHQPDDVPGRRRPAARVRLQGRARRPTPTGTTTSSPTRASRSRSAPSRSRPTPWCSTGEERDRLYAEQASRYPGFADYEGKTTRVIPVVALIRD